MLSFEEFAAGAKQVDHITGCTLGRDGNWVRFVVEAYLSNADGSVVERGRSALALTAEQYEFSTPGPWMLQTFDQAIAEKWKGYTRYATPKEIAAHKSAREVAC
ncbi:hypothetical protein A4F85_04730 [Delftia sp. GW456-R20]|uniref:hypothetical protein n=1 Tax=Delftia sp. GW456-R20 TaxID=1827145 RepID=UPI0007AE662D|nr:hypothetical protein [Delftia sp. GW456-R20]KZK32023.1 hypothetical protein A4F85_04730 [Delftia sp. GW456-R20]